MREVTRGLWRLQIIAELTSWECHIGKGTGHSSLKSTAFRQTNTFLPRSLDPASAAPLRVELSPKVFSNESQTSYVDS